MPTQLKLKTDAILKNKTTKEISKLPCHLRFEDNGSNVVFIEGIPTARWDLDMLSDMPPYMVIDVRQRIYCINFSDILKEAKSIISKKDYAEYKGPPFMVPLDEEEINPEHNEFSSSKKTFVKK